ncbi:MAG: alpha-2-macroglobulin family protein, partial [Janthinobacterium lividum]
MRTNIAAAVIVVVTSAAAATAAAAAAAVPTPTVTTDANGDSARACLEFGRALDTSADAHPGDFLTIEPAVRPTVTASGSQLCLDGLGYGAHYSITVHPGLAFIGSRGDAEVTATADTPDRDPLVAVGGRGWILPRQGATGVNIQTVNVPLVRIRVLRLAARKAAADAGGDAHWGDSLDPSKQSWQLYELRGRASSMTQIWSGTMQTGPGRNRTVETAFPLAGIVDPAKPGAYLILAEDAAKPAANLTPNPDDAASSDDSEQVIAGHWALSTDLAISSLQGRDGLHVTVRSLGSAAPLPGVRLELRAKSEDTLAEATTDAQGSAVFAPGLLRGKLASAAATLVASTAAGDFALQSLSAPGFDLSDRGADGRVSPGPIEAFVYTDRGIYRPGETINVTALLRTAGLSAVDGAGLTLVLRRPDGVEASRTMLPPAPDAGFGQALPLSASAAQGNWTIEAFVDPSLPPVGRASVSVTDFVPQQLKVGLTATAAAIGPETRMSGSIDGRFLYGARAAGLHAEGDVRLVRDEHPVAGAAQYSFGDADETIPDALTALTLADADDAGHVAIDTGLSVPDGISSPLRAVVSAGLVEPTGRAVKQTLSLPIHNHPLLIGIRKLFGDQVNEGSPAQFAVRTFGADGAPVAAAGLHWHLYTENHRWDWWRESGSGWTFHTYTTEDEIASGTLDTLSSAPAELARTLGWGEHRLVVGDDATGAASSVRFSSGWNGSANADIPDRLAVETDRAVVGSGETAHIHVRGPFAGPAQVIVESAGRVIETRRVEMAADGATLDLVATAGWGAGVHVLAEAFRPLAVAGKPHELVRAVGLAWVATDPAPHTLAVSVSVPAMVTPRQSITVPVHVAGSHGRAFVTLAAVDEGVLQLTHFASPDPVAALLGRTRFAMDLRDDYGRLLEGTADAGVLHEGGDGGSLGGAGLPVTSTKVVSLFHGPVELDAEGNAAIPLDLPDFAGELRLMAVAYDHEAAGHAEAALTVRDPVVAELALPRFLAPGDVASVGVSLQDTDAPAGDYHLAVTASGAAAWRGPGTIDVHLDPGQRREARLDLAGAEIGIAHLTADLTGPDGLHITHQWDIAVRSPHPDLVLSQAATQAPGETYTAGPDLLAPFVPGSVQVTIGYSATGGIDVPGLLQSLYTYPFGCTEQLSSSALPLLYFNDARLLGRPASDHGVHDRVQAAISTIIDRQDLAGRFG